MSDLIKIAVDAMGGDGSPKKIIDGIIHNKKIDNNNFFKIFGDQNEIKKHIDGKINDTSYEIVHTSNVVCFFIMNDTINNFFRRTITPHCINCNFN